VINRIVKKKGLEMREIRAANVLRVSVIIIRKKIDARSLK
jgi:hypothetical protein